MDDDDDDNDLVVVVTVGSRLMGMLVGMNAHGEMECDAREGL